MRIQTGFVVLGLLATAAAVAAPQASKTAALNLGDSQAQSFPRVYLDADIAIDVATVRKLAAALEGDDAAAASPTMRIDTTGRPCPSVCFSVARSSRSTPVFRRRKSSITLSLKSSTVLMRVPGGRSMPYSGKPGRSTSTS